MSLRPSVAEILANHVSFELESNRSDVPEPVVTEIKRYAADQQIPIVQFRKGQRKDDIAAQYLKGFNQPEGVLFI